RRARPTQAQGPPIQKPPPSSPRPSRLVQSRIDAEPAKAPRSNSLPEGEHELSRCFALHIGDAPIRDGSQQAELIELDTERHPAVGVGKFFDVHDNAYTEQGKQRVPAGPQPSLDFGLEGRQIADQTPHFGARATRLAPRSSRIWVPVEFQVAATV